MAYSEKSNRERASVLADRRILLITLDGSHTPAQRGGVNRCIPEALHLFVKQRHRHRAAGHVERRNEIADQRPGDPATSGFEPFADCVVHQIEFRQRCSAEAVDQKDYLTPRTIAQIGHDRTDHFRCDLVRRPELLAAASRFAVNADTDFHLVFAKIEGWLASRGHRAARERDPDRAGSLIDAITKHLQFGKTTPLLGRCAQNLLHDQRSGDTTPPGRIGRFFDRDVVICDHRYDRLSRHLARHVEIHDVAFVVLHDQQHPAAAVGGLNGGKNEIWRWRGEDLSGNGRVQHARSDEAAVQRLVSRAATRYQRDLALLEVPAQHKLRSLAKPHDVGMRCAKAGKTFIHHILDGIDQFLHPSLPALLLQLSSISLATFSANSLRSVSSLRFFCSLPKSGSIKVSRLLRSRSFRSNSRRGCARW